MKRSQGFRFVGAIVCVFAALTAIGSVMIADYAECRTLSVEDRSAVIGGDLWKCKPDPDCVANDTCFGYGTECQVGHQDCRVPGDYKACLVDESGFQFCESSMSTPCLFEMSCIFDEERNCSADPNSLLGAVYDGDTNCLNF